MLVGAWIILPLGVLAVVRIPNSDNHVRYVIETLPLAGIAIAYGRLDARPLRGLARGRRGGAGRGGARVRRRGRRAARASRTTASGATAWAVQKADLNTAAGYLRENFARNDLFLGYDEAFAAGVLAPGGNHALASARGTARSEPALIVRSLKRLHGPIAHGWYVALRGTSDARYQRFRSAPRGRLRRRELRHLVRARAQPRGARDAGRVRALRPARLRGRPGAVGARRARPSEQAAVTTAALKRALPDLR